MDDEKFDAIVVGAGPAGSAAALTMAKAGMNVVVFERGDQPGAKNVMGGVLFREATESVFGKFWEDGPVERPVVEQRLWLLGKESVVTAGFRAQEFGQPPYNAFTVLRARIDPYFARKAEEAGAYLITETQVTDLIWDNGKIAGVRTGREGDLYADVVLVAEGINAFAAVKAGLRRDFTMENAALAVKEVHALPAEVIDERFNVSGGEGVTILLTGELSHGMMGSGWIYTNKDTLSLGFGAIVSHMVETRARPNDLLEEMKAHPAIRPLLRGSEIKEYSAHLIPEVRYEELPRPYGDGYMLLGDTAGFVNFLYQEGSNLAIASGRMAGETAVAARERGDFSADTLSLYEEKLKNSFVLKDLHDLRNAPGFFRTHREFFGIYPRMINAAAKSFLTVDACSKKEKRGEIVRMILRGRPWWRIGKDMVDALRAFR
ncbi:MAG: NAD(P)/FAD-dependent oxidoreductase [Chloroflexi bacterium]|nr:NAD(P)/FAD-dependent oxidoreductase [Chloroflexota bacterium]